MMIIEELAKWSSCKIACIESGSGFFITENLIITCLHVVDGYEEKPISVWDYHNNLLAVEVIDQSESLDIALLRCINSSKGPCFVDVCASAVSLGMKWDAFGFPAHASGQMNGEALRGYVRDIIDVSRGSIEDCAHAIIDINSHTASYKGFSGSAMIDGNRNVIGILRYQSPNYLSSVSIIKCREFLNRNNIDIKPDELSDFNLYLSTAFDGYEDIPRLFCKPFSDQVINQNTPTNIVSSLLGNMFYPKRKDTEQELISKLRIFGPDGWSFYHM
jgi:hypothetical protein